MCVSMGPKGIVRIPSLLLGTVFQERYDRSSTVTVDLRDREVPIEMSVKFRRVKKTSGLLEVSFLIRHYRQI